MPTLLVLLSLTLSTIFFSATLDGSDFENADMTQANIELAQVSYSSLQSTPSIRIFDIIVIRLHKSITFLWNWFLWGLFQPEHVLHLSFTTTKN